MDRVDIEMLFSISHNTRTIHPVKLSVGRVRSDKKTFFLPSMKEWQTHTMPPSNGKHTWSAVAANSVISKDGLGSQVAKIYNLTLVSRENPLRTTPPPNTQIFSDILWSYLKVFLKGLSSFYKSSLFWSCCLEWFLESLPGLAPRGTGSLHSTLRYIVKLSTLHSPLGTPLPISFSNLPTKKV